MKAKINTHKTFDITLGKTAHKRFKIDSEWNGLYILKDEEGRQVIIEGNPENPGSREVIRVSSDLIPLGAQVDKQDGWTHVHCETGKPYRLIAITNQAATKPGWVESVTYTDGKEMWSRPLEEFNVRYTEL